MIFLQDPCGFSHTSSYKYCNKAKFKVLNPNAKIIRNGEYRVMCTVCKTKFLFIYIKNEDIIYKDRVIFII